MPVADSEFVHAPRLQLRSTLKRPIPSISTSDADESADGSGRVPNTSMMQTNGASIPPVNATLGMNMNMSMGMGMSMPANGVGMQADGGGAQQQQPLPPFQQQNPPQQFPMPMGMAQSHQQHQFAMPSGQSHQQTMGVGQSAQALSVGQSHQQVLSGQGLGDTPSGPSLNLPASLNLPSSLPGPPGPLLPSEHKVAGEYDSFLNELTFNSKEVINRLTKIAGENVPSCNAIAHVIEQRILRMPAPAKLPFLYLLDSISKNIGSLYITRFQRSIVPCFNCAFMCATPAVRGSMERLLNTWPPIFGPQIVAVIKAEVVKVKSQPRVEPPRGATVGLPGRSVGGAGPILTAPIVGPPTLSVMPRIEGACAELTRKSAMGITPTPVELASISSLISGQKHLPALSAADRNRLTSFEAQLNSFNLALRRFPSSVAPIGRIPRVTPPALTSARVPPPRTALRSRPTASAPPPPPLVQAKPVLSFANFKKLNHADTVRSLYSELTFLSKSDGMRFKNQLDLRAHMDWFFAQSKRKRARARASGGSGVSRCWYDAEDVFLGLKSAIPQVDTFAKNGASPASPTEVGAKSGNDAGSEVDVSPSCEARGDDEICPTCCEGFKSFWDDDKQAWMLKDAVRPDPSGSAYHSGCCVDDDEEDDEDEAGLSQGEEDRGVESSATGNKRTADEANGDDDEDSSPSNKRPKVEFSEV